jgi:hypothetical protein
MGPAHQGLASADPGLADIHHRLVVELEQSIGKRTPQVTFRYLESLRVNVHLRLLELEARALARRVASDASPPCRASPLPGTAPLPPIIHAIEHPDRKPAFAVLFSRFRLSA